MPFRKPVSTLGGLNFWKNIKEDTYFIMQKHKTGIWPYKYRILMRENSKEIANANDQYTIDMDWEYLRNHAVPRINDQGFLDLNRIIEDLISSKI